MPRGIYKRKPGRKTRSDAIYKGQSGWSRSNRGNPNKRRQRSRAWKSRNRVKNLAYMRQMALKRNYGITLADYENLLVLQGGGCAICSSHEPGSGHKHLHVDHDHAQNRVRGLLCPQCNVGLGMFKDDPLRLRLAADYLERRK